MSDQRHARSDGDGDSLQQRGGQRHAEEIEAVGVGDRAHSPAETKNEDQNISSPADLGNRGRPAGQYELNRDQGHDDRRDKQGQQRRVLDAVSAHDPVLQTERAAGHPRDKDESKT